MWSLTQQNYIITQFQTNDITFYTHLLQLLGAQGRDKLIWKTIAIQS